MPTIRRLLTPTEFRTEPLIYDARGIKIGNKYIVDFTCREYIQKSIQELSTRITAKKILEIGYGAGYVSEAIQLYFRPDLHIIVEARPEIAQQARDFALLHPSVQVVEDFVQSYHTNEAFDLIYDDREEMVFQIPFCFRFLRHKYWATFCHLATGQEDLNSGFIFRFNGEDWFQHYHSPDEIFFT